MTLGLAVALRNSMLDQIAARAGNNAIIQIWSGTRPATGAAPSGTKLAQLTMASSFAGAAANGVLTMGTVQADTSADANGTATWFRILQSDATTHVLDGSVSTIAAGTGDMQLDDVVIAAGGTVAIQSGTFTAGNA